MLKLGICPFVGSVFQLNIKDFSGGNKQQYIKALNILLYPVKVY